MENVSKKANTETVRIETVYVDKTYRNPTEGKDLQRIATYRTYKTTGISNGKYFGERRETQKVLDQV